MRLRLWWKLSLFVLSLFSQLHRRLLPGLARPVAFARSRVSEACRSWLPSKNCLFSFLMRRMPANSCPPRVRAFFWGFFLPPSRAFLYFSAISATWPDFPCGVMCCSEASLELIQHFIIFHERLTSLYSTKNTHTHIHNTELYSGSNSSGGFDRTRYLGRVARTRSGSEPVSALQQRRRRTTPPPCECADSPARPVKSANELMMEIRYKWGGTRRPPRFLPASADFQNEAHTDGKQRRFHSRECGQEQGWACSRLTVRGGFSLMARGGPESAGMEPKKE